MKKIVLSAIMATVAFGAFAQKSKSKSPAAKNTFEGKLVYEIVYEEVPESIEPYISMLPKEAINYVKGDKVRVEQTTMGMTTVNVMDNAKKTGFVLMDQFGKKSAYTMTSEDMKSDEKKGLEDYEVNYTSETKEIAGYTCKKVEMKHKKDNFTAYAWVTDEISGGANKNYSFLKGFALEFSVSAQGMVMVFKTKTLEKIKVADSYFEIPEGYEVKKMSDLQKEMEQMQGGGND